MPFFLRIRQSIHLGDDIFNRFFQRFAPFKVLLIGGFELFQSDLRFLGSFFDRRHGLEDSQLIGKSAYRGRQFLTFLIALFYFHQALACLFFLRRRLLQSLGRLLDFLPYICDRLLRNLPSIPSGIDDAGSSLIIVETLLETTISFFGRFEFLTHGKRFFVRVDRLVIPANLLKRDLPSAQFRLRVGSITIELSEYRFHLFAYAFEFAGKILDHPQ